MIEATNSSGMQKSAGSIVVIFASIPWNNRTVVLTSLIFISLHSIELLLKGSKKNCATNSNEPNFIAYITKKIDFCPFCFFRQKYVEIRNLVFDIKTKRITAYRGGSKT